MFEYGEEAWHGMDDPYSDEKANERIRERIREREERLLRASFDMGVRAARQHDLTALPSDPTSTTDDRFGRLRDLLGRLQSWTDAMDYDREVAWEVAESVGLLLVRVQEAERAQKSLTLSFSTYAGEHLTDLRLELEGGEGEGTTMLNLWGVYTVKVRAVLGGDVQEPTNCIRCNGDLHGYCGPLCRYCDGTAID